jgi:hypothetical protein
VELVCKLNHCPDRLCPGHAKTKSPELEVTIALPKSAIGWDVLCWIGHRRCSRHWSITQIRGELRDAYGIQLSEDSLARYIRQYQIMLAARQEDPAGLRQQYEAVDQIVLTIDGLQPEKGHETLYVVRELTQKRVWFAEPLISATADEVRRLFAKAKAWAKALGKPVVLWLSDRQDAFVTGIAAEFPGVPHRYCGNHFLRDVAKPVLEADSHAKVQMRKKVRGLRTIEQAVLKHQKTEEAPQVLPPDAAVNAPAAEAFTVESTLVESPLVEPPQVEPPFVEPTALPCAAAVTEPASSVADPPASVEPTESADTVVLEYCAAVRGILNDDQGGPLQPPGLRMTAALHEVRESIQRNLDEKKGASPRRNSNAWRAASTEVSTRSERTKTCCATT